LKTKEKNEIIFDQEVLQNIESRAQRFLSEHQSYQQKLEGELIVTFFFTDFYVYFCNFCRFLVIFTKLFIIVFTA
jgi:hypothetical protein